MPAAVRVRDSWYSALGGAAPSGFPRSTSCSNDVASLRYEGYETFGKYLDGWEPKGGLGQFLEPVGLPRFQPTAT